MKRVGIVGMGTTKFKARSTDKTYFALAFDTGAAVVHLHSRDPDTECLNSLRLTPLTLDTVRERGPSDRGRNLPDGKP
jgi:hypothetical protein